jgi:hypothetical protein
MSEEIQREWKQVTSRNRTHGMPALFIKKPKKECPNCGKYQFQEYKQERMEDSYMLEIFGHKLIKTEKIIEEEYENIHGECRNCDYRTEDIEE